MNYQAWYNQLVAGGYQGSYDDFIALIQAGDVVTYEAGMVTAYGAAVEGGYTGTYADFCTQQAQYAENAAYVADTMQALEHKLDAVTPGTEALLEQIEQAAASAPAELTAVTSSIASLYNGTATYKAGDYCFYNDSLYRCKTAIDTPEPDFVAAHWENAKMADDMQASVGDLKSAIANASSENIFKANDLTQRKYVTAEGLADHNLLGCTDYYEIPSWCNEIAYLNQLTSSGVVYVIEPPMVFYDANKENPVQVASPGNDYRGQVTNYAVPSGEKYVRFNYSLADADVMYISFVQGKFEELTAKVDENTLVVNGFSDDLNNQRLVIPVSYYGPDVVVETQNKDVIQKVKPSTPWGLYVFDKVTELKCNYSTNQYILLAYRDFPSTNTFQSLALCVASGQHYGKLVKFAVNSYTFDSSAITGFPSFDITQLAVTNNGNGTFSLFDGTNSFTVDISQRPEVAQYTMRYCIGGMASSYYNNGTVMQYLYNDYSAGVEKVNDMITEVVSRKSWYKDMMGACIGDSITAQATYISTLKTQLQLASLYNYGVSGTPIAKTSASDTTAFCVRVDSMNLAGVTMITVLGGTNDYGLNIPIGTADSTELTTFYGAVKYVISKLVTTRPKATLIFMTPTKRNLSGDPADGVNTAGHTLKDYRDVIIDVCADYSIPVLDLWAVSGMNSINLSNYTVDGLHWNSSMGVKMGKTIAEFLLAHPKAD